MKKLVLVFTWMIVMSFAFLSTQPVWAASEKSDAKNMELTLKYISRKNLNKARKYNQKLSTTASEKCNLKMSKKMKKAYLKIVKRYPVKGFGERTVLRDYYLTDIDNDKKTDLLIVIGSCESNSRLVVYRYKQGKAVKAGSIDACHTSYRAYPNHKGVVEVFGMHGRMTISILTLKKNKLIRKELGSMEFDDLGLKCKLKSHYRSSGDWYNRSCWMSTSDLK